MAGLISQPGTRLQRADLTRGLTEELSRPGSAGDDAPHDAGHRLADALLRDAVREGATDVHLDPQQDGTRVRFRIDGTLVDAALVGRGQGGRLARQLKAMCGMDPANAFKPANARLTYAVDDAEVDLRVAAAPTIGGEKLSVRLLDRGRAGQRLDELGLSDEPRQRVEHWLANICGMFLVAGPTGSGKTTTLYALLHELKLHERSVITVEDPVEYRVDGITQMQVDRRHGLTFAEGLRAALRLDPDYLLLGEVREPDDARAAVEAAGSGRVLMATIHAPDAVGAVTALRNRGLADHEIAASVQLVVAQRLVRRLCRRCRRRQKLTEADYQWLASVGLPTTPAETWVADGCDECRGLGYNGRVGAFEVWRLTDADYGRILAHADERTLRAHAGPGAPHWTLLHDGFAKVEQGVTSLAELRAVGPGYPAGSPRPAA